MMRRPLVIPDWPASIVTVDAGRYFAWTRSDGIEIRSAASGTEHEAWSQLPGAVMRPSEYGRLPGILIDDLRRDGIAPEGMEEA